jgi:hypothetical protein
MSLIVAPASRFSNTADTGIRVSRNTHAPPSRPGTLSTAGHWDQSRRAILLSSLQGNSTTEMGAALRASMHREAFVSKRRTGSERHVNTIPSPSSLETNHIIGLLLGRAASAWSPVTDRRRLQAKRPIIDNRSPPGLCGAANVARSIWRRRRFTRVRYRRRFRTRDRFRRP